MNFVSKMINDASKMMEFVSHMMQGLIDPGLNRSAPSGPQPAELPSMFDLPFGEGNVIEGDMGESD